MLADGLRPAWAVDLNSGQRSQVNDGRLPINLPPSEMAMYITPRASIAGSAAEWFDLQRGWWQGVGEPGAPFPKPEGKLTVDLTQDWLFQPVNPGQEGVSALVDPKTDDSAWEKVPLGIFTLPDRPDVRHFVVRKHFHVPGSWNHGRTLIRLPDNHADSVDYIDGKLYDQWHTPDPVFAAGSDHVLAVECQCKGPFGGTQGSVWLTYHPDPMARQNLAGKWETSPDALKWNGTATLPGDVAPDVKALRTTLRLDPSAPGKTIVFHAMARSRALRGVVINGQYVCPFDREGSELNVNVTPWVKPDRNNVLVLIGGGGETVNEISLEFHTPGTYP